MDNRFFHVFACVFGIVGSLFNAILCHNAWLLFLILESFCVTIATSLYRIGSLIHDQAVLSNQFSSLQDSLKKLNAEFYTLQTANDEKIVPPELVSPEMTDFSGMLVRCPYCGRIYEKNPFGCIFCHRKD